MRTPQFIRPDAWDCVLSFCAKSYSSSEHLGFFNEMITDVFDEPNWTTLGDLNSNHSFNVPPTHLTTISNQSRAFAIDKTALFTLQNPLGSTLVGGGGQTSGDIVQFTSDIAQGFYYRGIEAQRATRYRLLSPVSQMHLQMHYAWSRDSRLREPALHLWSMSTSNGCGCSCQLLW